MAAKKDSSRGKSKTARASKPKRTRAPKPIVESSAPPALNEAIAAPPPSADSAAQPAPAQPQQQQQQQQTTISTSRGFADFLVTNRLSLALTSYQTGQLMLIGPLLDGRLSVFQRNFVRAMG